MASKVNVTKAAEMSKIATKKVCAYYKQVLGELNMASKVNVTKAAEMYKITTKKVCAYYKQVLEQNKQYIQEPPTVENCKKLSNQLYYTRLASLPGRYEAFGKELDHFKHLIKNRKDLKTEDAGIAALFGLELLAWFYGGKIVGRGFKLTGDHV